MATTTQETQVAGLANQIIALSAGLYGMQQQINTLSAEWTNLSAGTKINAFPTAALTTTGGLSPTPDGSSNVANPINTSVSPGTLLSRAISPNDLAGLLTFLQGAALVIGGSAVSANGAAVQLIAKTL